MCFSLNNKYFNLHFAKNLRRTHPLHSFSIGRRSLWLSEKGVSEKERESILKRRTLHRRRILCAARPRSLHGTFRISISGPRSFTGPSSSLCLSYPFVPFIQRPFVSRPGVFSPLRRLAIPPSLPFSLRVYPTSRLLVHESRRYVAIFLQVLFWRTSGSWHADKGNLLSQEISGGKGVARARG
ncbi:hypothetical protein ACS0PU_002149 [Formica fusca]